MAILQNQTINAQYPYRRFGGVNAGENAMWRRAERRNIYVGDAGWDKKNGIAVGTLHPTAIVMPMQDGGMSAFNSITGAGTLTGAGALGINIAADLVGISDFSGTGQLIVSGVANITGAGTLTGDILAALLGSADLTASGSLSGTILATGALSAPLTGVGSLSVASYARGFMFADIVNPTVLEAQAFSAQMLDQELVETGLTVREALRLVAAATAGKITGGGTATVTIRNAVADGADRIVATVDSNGNRTAITYDLD